MTDVFRACDSFKNLIFAVLASVLHRSCICLASVLHRSCIGLASVLHWSWVGSWIGIALVCVSVLHWFCIRSLIGFGLVCGFVLFVWWLCFVWVAVWCVSLCRYGCGI